MKFNDNTVNEASWEELAKESMGGHSNTSAYSLVYIDMSKPELLLDAEWAGSIGETVEEKMDQGELEALAKILPNDLATYVVEDNFAFEDEIIKWDKEQEIIKEQELLAATMPEEQRLVTSASDACDVQVKPKTDPDEVDSLIHFSGGRRKAHLRQQSRKTLIGPDVEGV